MNVFDRIREAFKKYTGNALPFNGTDVFTGRQYPERFDYLELYRKGSWVYACVQKISNSIAGSTWWLYRGDREITDHRALWLFEKPNQFMTRYELMNMTVQSLELIGEAHWLIMRNESGKPVALFPLNSSQMEMIMKNGVPDHWEYNLQSDRQELLFEDVVFFKYTDPSNPWRGVAPLHAASIAADSDLDASRWNRTFFKNSAAPASALEIDSKLSNEQFLVYKKQVEAFYKGVNNAHKTIVLDSGMKFKNIQLSQKDMEFLELRKFSREEIAAVFGVPLSKLGLNENSNRATAYIHDYSFAKETLTPKLRMIQGALNKYFATTFEDNLHFEFESVIPKDDETSAKINNIYLTQGVLTVDEVRESLGYEPLKKKTESPKQLEKSKSYQNDIRSIGDGEVKDFKGWITARFEQQRREMIRRAQRLTLQKMSFFEASNFADFIAAFLLQGTEQAIWEEELQERMKDPLKMAGQALAGAYGIGINFTQFDENIERMLMRRSQRFARQINETTYNDLRRVLIDRMVESGLNERELRNDINNVMSLTKRQRAETIARTEVFSAINESTNMTFKDNGIQRKKWLAAIDERTRPAHAAASGQIVKTEEPFNVGGDRLMYPGDPSGSPGNIINCRCTLIPVVE